MTLDSQLHLAFAGATRYSDHYPGDDHNRIVVLVRFGHTLPDLIPCIVDTGSPWTVLDPRRAEERGIDYRSGYPVDKKTGYRIRGIKYGGWSCREAVSLVASDNYGTSIDVEVTLFVPDLGPNEDWLHPNFLGLDNFLNQIRFAVDPRKNLFYFHSNVDE
jgi:hypothetical protein